MRLLFFSRARVRLKVRLAGARHAHFTDVVVALGKVIVRLFELAAHFDARKATRDTLVAIPQVDTDHQHHAECQQDQTQQIRVHNELSIPFAYSAAIAAASSTSTETRRDTPGSCMVTPDS